MTGDPYRVEPFADEHRAAVLDVWAREGALPEAEARRRVHEVVLVGRALDGALAGVASAFLKRNAQLRMDLWHGRVFVAAAHRRSNLGATLALRAREMLQEAFVTGRDTRGAGMLFEVESTELKQHVDLAVWRQTDFTFIGVNERGDHVRVFYFPGARAPLP